jgi:hypothetical protein
MKHLEASAAEQVGRMIGEEDIVAAQQRNHTRMFGVRHTDIEYSWNA